MRFRFTLGNILKIIAGIGAIILLVISFPLIEVKMYLGNEKSYAPADAYASSNVKIFLDKDGDGFSESRVCFNISNRAQKYGNYDLPANNFNVKIETTATCKDCELITGYKDFHAQTNKQLCKFVRSSNQSIEFKVMSTYDAIIPNMSHTAKYVCELQDDTQYRNQYVCNLK